MLSGKAGVVEEITEVELKIKGANVEKKEG
jgi:hypothetical protein